MYICRERTYASNMFTNVHNCNASKASSQEEVSQKSKLAVNVAKFDWWLQVSKITLDCGDVTKR